MRKLKIIIILIIVLLIICFFINFVHNFVIYSSILDKTSVYLESSNVYYEKYSSEATDDLIKYSKLNNLEKIETLKNNSIYSIQWNDYNSNEFLDFYVQDKIVHKHFEKPEKYSLPFLVTEADNTFSNKLAKSLCSFILTKNIDGKDCYVISSIGGKYYIDKDTGLPMRKEEKIVVNNQEKTVSLTYENWKFEELKMEDMSKPDTTDYKE